MIPIRVAGQIELLSGDMREVDFDRDHTIQIKGSGQQSVIIPSK